MEENWNKVENNLNQVESTAEQERQNTYSSLAKSLSEKKFGKEYKPTRLERQKTEIKTASYEQIVDDLLGEPDSPERALAKLRTENCVQALRASKIHDKNITELKIDEELYLERKRAGVSLSMAEQNDLIAIRQEIRTVQDDENNLELSNPEAFTVLNLQRLKEYKKQLRGGKIVETPYVKKNMEDISEAIKNGNPVMITGDLGSGKTELARHTAIKSTGKSPLIISGSKHTTQSEFYGHQILTTANIDENEYKGFISQVESDFADWKKNNPEKTEHEQSLYHDTVLQTNLYKLKGGTISKYYMGPIYQAMKNGQVVILDEFNAIPHELLIGLNDILTRKPGNEINIQQDSGEKITIQPGFCVIATGNIGNKYVGRQDIDPAFHSRFSTKINYDYLPNSKEGSIDEEAGKHNELFQVLLTRLCDEKGNIVCPPDAIRNLWRLSQAARAIQDNFSGKPLESTYFMQQAGTAPIEYRLRKSVLSIRDLDNIIIDWTNQMYLKKVDHYIWDKFVKGSNQNSPDDARYLYQLFQGKFGFFDKDEGWPDANMVGNNHSIVIPDNVEDTESNERIFIHKRQVVEYAFGKAPERSKWPEIENGSGDDDAQMAGDNILEDVETEGEYEKFLNNPNIPQWQKDSFIEKNKNR
jgi:MoxR-like ATPase